MKQTEVERLIQKWAKVPRIGDTGLKQGECPDHEAYSAAYPAVLCTAGGSGAAAADFALVRRRRTGQAMCHSGLD